MRGMVKKKNRREQNKKVMLLELKLPRKSPTSFPVKSPILYIIRKMMAAHVGFTVVFASIVRFGKSIKVITKSNRMYRGYGLVTRNAYHISFAYDFLFSMVLFSVLTRDQLNFQVGIVSLSLAKTFYICYIYSSDFIILKFKYKSHMLNKIAIRKYTKKGAILPGWSLPKPAVMTALRIIKESPEAAVPIVNLETVLNPKQLIIAKNESWTRFEANPTAKHKIILSQNPTAMLSLQMILTIRSSSKQILVPIMPKTIIVLQLNFKLIELNMMPVSTQATKTGMGKYRYTLYPLQIVLKQSRELSTAFQPNKDVIPLRKKRFSALSSEKVESFLSSAIGYRFFYFYNYYRRNQQILELKIQIQFQFKTEINKTDNQPANRLLNHKFYNNQSIVSILFLNLSSKSKDIDFSYILLQRFFSFSTRIFFSPAEINFYPVEPFGDWIDQCMETNDFFIFISIFFSETLL